MFSLIKTQKVTNTYLNFFFTFITVSYYSSTFYFVYYWCSFWKNRQGEASVLVKLEHQVEVSRRANTFLARWLDRTHYFLVVMLVRFVIENFKHFEVLWNVLAYYNRDLNCWNRIIDSWFRIEFHPIVNRILYITNPISIAKNLETSGLPWMIESLKLFIPIVLHEVHHILINIRKRWLRPLEAFNIDKSVQVVNAKAQVNMVTWCNLYFILCYSRHTIRYMDPCSSWLSSCFDDVKSVCVVIYNFLTLSIFFLSSLGPKDHRVGTDATTTSYISCVSFWVLNFISVHVFQLQCLTCVLHQLKAICS